MAEYIERQKLINAIPTVDEDKKISLYGAVVDFMIIASSIPTADVVEVVRCKDCEQFMQQYDIHNGRKLHYGICKLNSNKFHDEEVNCDHFCSYGKRKEGAEE